MGNGADAAAAEETNKYGVTAYLDACGNGHVECIEALAHAGCNRKAKDNRGATGLMWAVGSGHVAAVQTVLALGDADIEARDKFDHTAYLGACSLGYVECIKALGPVMTAS